MCEPTTIAALSIAATVASTAMGAVSSIQEGKAAADAAKYQSRVAQNNAILADRAAKDAGERGARAEAERRAMGRRVLGAQAAAFAAQGVDLGSESVADIQASQAGLNELDALTVRSNTAREMLGFRIEGANYRSQADALNAQAQNYRYAGKMGAASTVLAGAGKVANQWYSFGMGNPFASKPAGGMYNGGTYTNSLTGLRVGGV